MNTVKVQSPNKLYEVPEWIDRHYHEQITTIEQMYDALMVRYMYFYPSRINNLSKDEILSILTSIVKFETKFPYDVYEDTTLFESSEAASLLKGKDTAFLSQLLSGDPRRDDMELEDFLEPELDISSPKDYVNHYARLLAFNKQPLANTPISELYSFTEQDAQDDIEKFEIPLYIRIDPSFDNKAIRASLNSILEKIRENNIHHNESIKTFIERCIDKHALLMYDLSTWFYANDEEIVFPKSDWNDLIFYKEYIDNGEIVSSGKYRTVVKNFNLMKKQSTLLQLRKYILQSKK